MICPKCGNTITIEEFSCSRCGMRLPVHTREERIRAEAYAAKLQADTAAQGGAVPAGSMQGAQSGAAPAGNVQGAQSGAVPAGSMQGAQSGAAPAGNVQAVQSGTVLAGSPQTAQTVAGAVQMPQYGQTSSQVVKKLRPEEIRSADAESAKPASRFFRRKNRSAEKPGAASADKAERPADSEMKIIQIPDVQPVESDPNAKPSVKIVHQSVFFGTKPKSGEQFGIDPNRPLDPHEFYEEPIIVPPRYNADGIRVVDVPDPPKPVKYEADKFKQPRYDRVRLIPSTPANLDGAAERMTDRPGQPRGNGNTSTPGATVIPPSGMGVEPASAERAFSSQPAGQDLTGRVESAFSGIKSMFSRLKRGSFAGGKKSAPSMPQHPGDDQTGEAGDPDDPANPLSRVRSGSLLPAPAYADAYFRIWKLLSGIICVPLFFLVILTSFVSGFINTLTNTILGTAESSGLSGFVLAVLMLTGGVVSIVTHKKKSPGSNLAIALLFGAAFVAGISGISGIHAWMGLWAAWCGVCMVLGFTALLRCYTDRTAVAVLVPVLSSVAVIALSGVMVYSGVRAYQQRLASSATAFLEGAPSALVDAANRFLYSFGDGTQLESFRTADAPEGVTPSFKMQMDEFEQAMDEYIGIMQQDAGDPASMETWQEQYGSLAESISRIDENALTDADKAYLEFIYTRLAIRAMDMLGDT